MAEDKLYVLASDIAISEEHRSNDIFLLVEMRILSTKPNGNKQGVTVAFIDEIVSNPEKYACLPLYADVRRLLQEDYLRLGHMYNKESGEFHTTQVGSITSFRKVEDEFGVSLIAQGRIPKREADVCQCIETLYDRNMLNFSFEIRYVQEATVEKDGVMYVDVNEQNALTGVAIVTVPAYKESVALNLVAEQQNGDVSGAEGVEKTMTLEEAMAKIAEQEAIIAELTVHEEKTEQKTVTVEGDLPPEATKDMEDCYAACDPGKESACAASVQDDKTCAESDQNKNTNTCAECETDKTGCAEAGAYQQSLSAARLENAECKKQIAELTAKCETLQCELEAALKCKAELEQMKQEKAARELAENQAKAKCFAEQQGLNPEDERVGRAIAELDYRAIAEMCMSKMEDSREHQNVAVASMLTDGFEMKGGKYDDLLAPAN